jgi:hypothetical protein
VVTGGLPSWRIILVVAAAAALAAAVVILTRPRQQPAASALAPAEPPPTDIARGATRLRSGRVHDQHGHAGSRSQEPGRPARTEATAVNANDAHLTVRQPHTRGSTTSSHYP